MELAIGLNRGPKSSQPQQGKGWRNTGMLPGLCGSFFGKLWQISFSYTFPFRWAQQKVKHRGKQ